MMRLILLTLLVAICSHAAYSQRTTRKGLKLEPTEQPAAYDTIATAKGDLAISGYEKAQSSTTESMFVTNNTAHTIEGINLTITYQNLKGQQLHRRILTVKCQIPPGETYSVDFKAWDKQKLWYYKDTQARHNGHASPYDLKIHVNYILISAGS